MPVLVGVAYSVSEICPCPEREIWPFLKGSYISETKQATPTKTGVHARDINLYLHTFFELILIN